MPDCLACQGEHEHEFDFYLCEQQAMFDLLIELGTITKDTMNQLRPKREGE